MNDHLENAIASTFAESHALRQQFKHAAPRYVRRLSTKLLAAYYLWQPFFRLHTNRWCVFQDSPDWLVHALASTARRKGVRELSEAGQKLVAEATDEWQLRKRKRQIARSKTYASTF